MLVYGTQMHIVTFTFICIELLILIYLSAYRIARPGDTTNLLDIVLLLLLITYNITGGLFPDSHLPGSFILQESIAYGTGFITPCYFPYFVYKAFGLQQMRFHALKGIWFFLVIPYLFFVSLLIASNNLGSAKNILLVPVLYALWVIYSLTSALGAKHSIEEKAILYFCLAPWVALPAIAYFDLNQAIEVIITNSGFLLLLALHVKRNILLLREEHLRLLESESLLELWHSRFHKELSLRIMHFQSIDFDEKLARNSKQFRLTNREKEIATLIAKGLTHKQIGEKLFIAERTVAKHVQNIFEKTCVSSKMELFYKLGA
jgi:DNA-binding CsgD family transcriptional regulator